MRAQHVDLTPRIAEERRDPPRHLVERALARGAVLLPVRHRRRRLSRTPQSGAIRQRHAGVSFRFAPLDVGSLRRLPCHLLRRRCDGVGRCESTSSDADDATRPDVTSWRPQESPRRVPPRAVPPRDPAALDVHHLVDPRDHRLTDYRRRRAVRCSPPTALGAPDQLGRTSSSRANAGAICSISTSARPCCLATRCQRETAAATSRSTSRAACGESRKYGATARASSTLAAVSLSSIAVLRYVCPCDGSGLRSKAGESRHESPRACRKPWLRRWSSVLAISTEKMIRRHS